MKKWKILYKAKIKEQKVKNEEIIDILLSNRGFFEKKDIANFLNPNIESVDLETSQIDKIEFNKFKRIIDEAILKNEKIVVYGDYDVDGITASAILFETLYSKTKNVTAYIPSRKDEGYGLSKIGIDNLLEKYPDTKIIITVDNGIVANEAVDYANKKKIEVIVTDHHVKGKKLPNAICILHTTVLCGAGIAWVLAKELEFETRDKIDEKLELAALATIADLVPLVGNNRAIVKFGIEILKKTKRVGLLELFKIAGISIQTISVYTIGHMIAPRLNATGRISHAISSLRLICTKDHKKAVRLAEILNKINTRRQELTKTGIDHAKLSSIGYELDKKVIVVASSTYDAGVVGLIASGLVECYYKPSFAISVGEKVSRGSARSIQGVNIVELLRSVSGVLSEVGGHPMAAGFSLETKRISEFEKSINQKAEEVIRADMLTRFLKIDLVIPFEFVSKKLFDEISKLNPYGMNNPEPVFATYGVEVVDSRKIGKDRSHLKMKVLKDEKIFDAVAFGMAEKLDVLKGDKIDIAYVIDENEWNGKKSLQLKIRDIIQIT